jgi:DNA-binding PadR family transcriptional regulator
MKILTRKDEMVLLAILRLGDEASLVAMRELLIQETGQQWSVGNVFVSLEKLERAGSIRSRLGEPTGKRGGRAVKYYDVTAQGLAELRQTKEIQDGLWVGVHESVFNKQR